MKNSNRGWMIFAALLIATGLALSVSACKKEKEPEPAPILDPDKPATPSPARAEVDESRLRYVIQVTDPGQGQMRMEYSFDKPRMNMKMTMNEGAGWQVMTHIISDGKAVFMVNEADRSVMKMPLNQDMIDQMVPDQLMSTLVYDEFVRELGVGTPKKTGTDTVGGTKVTKYEIQEPDGEGLMWLSVDNKGLVRKVEVRDGGVGAEISTMEVIELDLNPKFSAKEFEPPAGYTVNDLSGMMEQP